MEKIWIWLAWRLPKRLVYWASVRLMVSASVGTHSGEPVPDMTITDVLSRW